MKHEWTARSRASNEGPAKCSADESGLWLNEELIGFPEAGREILHLARELQQAVRESLASSNAFQDDLAALLRAASLSDHARPASPHQVVQQELLPRVQYLTARERILAERVTMLEKQVGKQRITIRQALLEEVESLTRYVTWDDGEKRGRPIDEPFITAAEMRSILDCVIPEE